MTILSTILTLAPALAIISQASSTLYDVNPTKTDRRFDGIGGISGGGATSKLLVNYPEPQRSRILDYLFLPNFGASLDILKIEIGGDSQTTDGTEASHMHEPWDENYQRGYEWWLMAEAKKRSPDIKIYALPWAFPGWVAKGRGDPYLYPELTATYVTKFLNGAKVVHNITVDYVGIWNERPYNVGYVKLLRKMMDSNPYLKNTKIVAADSNNWGLIDDMNKDKEFNASVDYIGVHYPGTHIPDKAINAGKPVWSSEDYSTFNDDIGAGCWARILNRNFANGHMTSTIAWNLIGSYYEGLPFRRNGLMTADQPWSGHYDINNPIWVTAHTTQFTDPGWFYLKTGFGSGHLSAGGSYVAFLSHDKKDITLVIETMSHDHSICVRPPLPPYSSKPQTATFNLTGDFAKLTKLYAWFTKFDFTGGETKSFSQLEPLVVKEGLVTLELDVDVIYTLTTLSAGKKGAYPVAPIAKPFPLPYEDAFDNYDIYKEPYNFSPQAGVFEIRASTETNNSKVVQQVMQHAPIHWCPNLLSSPITVIGDNKWANVSVSVDFNIPRMNATEGVFVAARVNTGGCETFFAKGIFFFIMASGDYILSLDLERTSMIKSGTLSNFKLGNWYSLNLVVSYNATITGSVDEKPVVKINLPISGISSNGFAAIGTDTYGHAYFRRFKVDKAPENSRDLF